MKALFKDPMIMQGAVFVGVALLVLVISHFFLNVQDKRVARRIARVQQHKKIQNISGDEQSLRRRTGDTSLPTITRLLQRFPNIEQFRFRLEKAGLDISLERYAAICATATLLVAMLVMVLGKKALLGLFVGIIIGVGIPHIVVGIMAGRRVKKFISLFPDAIDLIVRGLRSGLPVTESIQMVSREIEEPVGNVFGSIAESIRLGVPVEKSLQSEAKKLGSTEFNFFVTAIVLQRETGGNLSEILNNLSEVLRTRFMMRMKIKALSSEAKASAIIVGSLPFIVIAALKFIQPHYLDILFDDTRGNIAALGALSSLGFGIFIMMKMSKFEI